ncbi:MAG: AAA family ATPase [Polyangiaceae bacterium]|nr:AAA family ATPase [Polyangiaceae bacterium]
MSTIRHSDEDDALDDSEDGEDRGPHASGARATVFLNRLVLDIAGLRDADPPRPAVDFLRAFAHGRNASPEHFGLHEFMQTVWPHGAPATVYVSNVGDGNSVHRLALLVRPSCEGPLGLTPSVGGLTLGLLVHRRQGKLAISRVEVTPHVPLRDFEARVSAPLIYRDPDQYMHAGDFDALHGLPSRRTETRARLTTWTQYLEWKQRQIEASQFHVAYTAWRWRSETMLEFLTSKADHPKRQLKDVEVGVQAAPSDDDDGTSSSARPPKKTSRRTRDPDVTNLGDIESIGLERNPAKLKEQWGDVKLGPEHCGVRVRLDEDCVESLRRRPPPEVGLLVSSIAGDISPLRNQQSGVGRLTNNQGFSPRLADFIFDATGASIPFEVPDLPDVPGSRSLNADQRKAVAKALAAPDLCLIQGPPGTGKTTVIADICLRAAHDGMRVLVASQTNLAVDNALARLSDAPGIRPLRLGKADKVDLEYQDLLAENVVARWFLSIADTCRRRMESHARVEADLLARERGAANMGVALAAITEADAALTRSRLKVSQAREELQHASAILKRTEEALADASRQATWLRQTALWAAEGGPLPAAAAGEPWPPAVALSRCLFGIVPTLAAIDRLRARREPLQRLFDAVDSARSEAASETPGVQELQALRAEQARLMHSVEDDELRRLGEVNKRIKELEQGGWNQVTGAIGRASREAWAAGKAPDCIRRVVEALKPSPEVDEELRSAHALVTSELSTADAADECVTRSSPVWTERASGAESRVGDLRAATSYARDDTARAEKGLQRSFEVEQEAQQNASSARDRWDEAWSQCWPDVVPELPTADAVARAQRAVADTHDASGARIARAARWQTVQSEWTARLHRATESDRDHLQALYVRHANVVGMTCNEAGARRTWQDSGFKPFDIVIVDEVSKATPPELILPLLLGKKAVLVGDHRQLPPMFREREATFGDAVEEGQLSKEDFAKLRAMVTASLFENLFTSAPDATKATLWIQYRMHPRIMDAVNQFYEGRLQAGPSRDELERARQHHLTIEDDAGAKLLEPSQNLLWVDTSQAPDGSSAWEQQEGSSKANLLEVEVVVGMLVRLGRALVARGYGQKRVIDVPAQLTPQTWAEVVRKAMPELPEETLTELFDERRVRVDGRAQKPDGATLAGARIEVQRQKEVGVITFYGAQLRALRGAIDAARGRYPREFATMEVRTNTVDRFQGMEKPIIIVSLVRAKRGQLGSFVREFQRINVGLSRAQQLLVVVGAEDTWKQAAIPMPPLDDGPTVEVRAYQEIIELTRRAGGRRLARQVICE